VGFDIMDKYSLDFLHISDAEKNGSTLRQYIGYT
jgi:hypothetical protein